MSQLIFTDEEFTKFQASLSDYITKQPITKMQLVQFNRNPIWLNIVKSMESTILVMTNSILSADTIEEVKQYQQIIYDIKFFLNLPNELKIMLDKSEKKEKDDGKQ